MDVVRASRLPRAEEYVAKALQLERFYRITYPEDIPPPTVVLGLYETGQFEVAQTHVGVSMASTARSFGLGGLLTISPNERRATMVY